MTNSYPGGVFCKRLIPYKFILSRSFVLHHHSGGQFPVSWLLHLPSLEVSNSSAILTFPLGFRSCSFICSTFHSMIPPSDLAVLLSTAMGALSGSNHWFSFPEDDLHSSVTIT
ncbi:unnamed protein product [Citrullus colocynthis]|uniref:Uncharacterized protein n=1 Tax=Citrullus colocynthis TaxID=252529 RepID=A0ABP0YJV5_9ROSI